MDCTDFSIASHATDSTDRSMSVLSIALRMSGWELISVDINAVSRKIRVEVRRNDGLHVTLDGDDRRASITREMVYTERVSVGAGGCLSNGRGGLPVDRLSTRMVGRDRTSGIRSGMKFLAHYVADNSDASRLNFRRAFATLLSDWPH